MISVGAFISARPEMSPQKRAMLRFLETAADKIRVDEKPKGRSQIECRFDCGAYKGEEIVTFRYDELKPLLIAVRLSGLSSGHSFPFPQAELACLKEMGFDPDAEAKNNPEVE